jgi:hypothetical protein
MIKVMIPKARDQPQLLSRFLLDMEKTISEIPLNKKESAKKIDNASSDVIGDVNATILTTMKRMPTNKGIYQCLTDFLNEFKKWKFIVLKFDC